MDQRGVVIYTKEEIDQLNESISRMLKESDAKCALLVDRDGHMITRQGSTQSMDTSALAALVAGSFASTKEIARLVGEPEFSVLFHQGKKDSIHISLVDEQSILVVIFDDRTTIGMVRLFVKETAEKLAKLFEEARKKAGEEPEVQLDEDFSSSAAEKLDNLFNK